MEIIIHELKIIGGNYTEKIEKVLIYTEKLKKGKTIGKRESS
jgi:hypothetical protein